MFVFWGVGQKWGRGGVFSILLDAERAFSFGFSLIVRRDGEMICKIVCGSFSDGFAGRSSMIRGICFPVSLC